ncbi:MAG: acetyl-CoA carboxylase carboxyl transferase subunit beta, partial [Acidiphilium sp. 21-66-27]
MNWLSEFVRPRIRTLLGRKEAPDNLWHQCSACQQMIFHRELETNLKVCPHCGHHMRATAAERLAWTFDGGKFQRIDLPRVPVDPLKFQDRKKYPDRLADARRKTGMEDAVLVAHGTVGGHRAVIAAMDFRFMGGSMGAAMGEALVAAARLAVLQ